MEKIIHKMEKLGFALDDDSATCDQKEINLKESRLLSIQRCIKHLTHACQCRDAKCRLPNCQKMKRIVQHTKSCKLKTNGGCSICRQLIALCCYHAKYCQVANCPVSYCSSVKNKMKHRQMQERLQQAQILKRRIDTMRNRNIFAVLQASPNNSNSSNHPSPGAEPHSSPFPPQPDIGMEPSTASPIGALQAVRQVQAAAAGLTAPHMVAAPQTQPNPQLGLRQPTQLMGGPSNMSNSIGNSAMGPPQVMPNPGPSSEDKQRPTKAWQLLFEALKSPPSAQQQQQVLAILKSNPQLIQYLQLSNKGLPNNSNSSS